MKAGITQTFFKLFDVMLLPFSIFLLPFLKLIRKYGVENFPLHKKAFAAIGVFPIRDHYYEPQLTYSKDFDAKKIRNLQINFNLPEQLEQLSLLQFSEELLQFERDGVPKLDKYYVNNPSFGPGDADLYYLVIRNTKPKRIIEIGCGYSSLLAVEAIKKNKEEGHGTELICIEPFEMPCLERVPEIKVIREKVEQVPWDIFNSLEENDILFIDSSHIIRPENDVLFEYLELLPRINPGVLIHIHDIFSPRHYRIEWLTGKCWFWNEQYLLEAFLYYNDSFRILYSMNYLKNNEYNATKEKLRNLEPDSEPASFWLKKIN